jgi:hypothetical protein
MHEKKVHKQDNSKQCAMKLTQTLVTLLSQTNGKWEDQVTTDKYVTRDLLICSTGVTSSCMT